MTMLASQITSLTVVYSIVYSGVNQRKHQSSASLAFVREIHRGPVNFPHKWPVTRKMFPFDDVIMIWIKTKSDDGTCAQVLYTLKPLRKHPNVDTWLWCFGRRVYNVHDICFTWNFQMQINLLTLPVFHMCLHVYLLIDTLYMWLLFADHFPLAFGSLYYMDQVTKVWLSC